MLDRNVSVWLAACRSLDRIVVSRTWNQRTLTELTRKTRSKLRPFGVKVLSCALTDLTTCSVMRVIGEGVSVVPSVAGDE